MTSDTQTYNIRYTDIHDIKYTSIYNRYTDIYDIKYIQTDKTLDTQTDMAHYIYACLH